MLVRFTYTDPDQAVANLIPGFITKIKKLLETVCHNCGKIKVDEVCHPASSLLEGFLPNANK